MGERAITARSDIYSLGAMTYEMLAGAPPFVGPNSQAIVAQVLTTEPTPLSSHRKSVPEHVNFAVRTALEKLPADRFGSAAEFAAALASPATHAQLVTAQAVRRAWWEDRTKLALGAVAVIATAAAAWGWANVAASSRARGLGGSAAAPWLATLEFPDSARPVGPFAISPDGSRLVYVARGPRGMQLWARDAGLLDPRPLAGTDSASYPAISPDGSKIAYLASHALRVVSTAGGLATTVADTLSTFSVIEWSDDEHILMTGQQGIVRVPLHGGGWQRLTTIDTAGGEVFHTAPSRLPGDRAILFTVIPRNYGDDSRFQIAISDPATGHHKILMPGFWARYVEPGYLLVVRPDGVLVAVPFDLTAHRITGPAVPLARQISEETFPAIAVARTGQLVFTAGSGTTTRLSFARVGRGGTATLLDSTWAGSVSEVAASPDGARLASIVNTGTWDVEIRDLHTGGASRIHVTGAVADDPVFSADGRTLFYVTNNPVEGAVYQAAVGSATSPRLVLRDTAMNLWEPAPSPDGRTLYYVKRRGGRSDIYAHALARAGAPDWPLTATTARESSPSPSPDGRWLAYVSDESGRRELYVRSTDSSRAERWTISVNGGASPRWSRDGRELFYVSRDTLMAAEVETAGELSVRSRRALFSLARFSTQRTSYDVLPGTGGFLMLEKRDTTGAAPRIVFVDQWRSLLGQAGESRSP